MHECHFNCIFIFRFFTERGIPVFLHVLVIQTYQRFFESAPAGSRDMAAVAAM